MKVELDLKYRSKILFHFIVFWREEGMGVLTALNNVCNFKKMKISLVYLFVYIS